MFQRIAPVLVLTALPLSVQAEAPKPWTVAAELGAISTSGNTESTSIKSKIDAKQELARWRNQYIFDSLYNSSDDSDTGESNRTAEKYFASAQGDYKLNAEHDTWFVFGSHLHDNFGTFHTQSVVATGWGTRLYETETSTLDGNLGPGYSWGEKQDGERIEGAILRGQLSYAWQVSPNAKFTQKLTAEMGAGNTKTVSETALATKINGSMQMKLGLNITHNSEDVPNRENTDREMYVTLVYNY